MTLFKAFGTNRSFISLAITATVAFLIPCLVSAAVVSSQATLDGGLYTYSYHITPTAGDTPANPVTEWILPILDGHGFDLVSARVTTPALWSAELRQAPYSQWNYTGLNDPTQYGLDAGTFESSEWLLRFILDTDARNSRIDDLQNQLAQLRTDIQMDVLKLNHMMSERNRILDLLSNMNPNHPFYAIYRESLEGTAREPGLNSQVDYLSGIIQTQSDLIAAMETEQDNLVTSNYSGFSFLSSQGPIFGPAQIGFLNNTDQFVSVQIPADSANTVPTPGSMGLLGFGLLIVSQLGRKRQKVN